MSNVKELPVGTKVYSSPQVLPNIISDTFKIVRSYYEIGNGAFKEEVMADGFKTQDDAEYEMAMMKITGKY